jgi:CheY-like chemotaxis protein
MGEKARKKGLDFTLNYHFPIPEIINSDPTRLKQILINLCGNAIKFTAEGHITLDTNFDKISNKIIFTIEDTGIGMTQEQISELFKPFKQADTSTARKFGGTGLGLYISKQLSERLGGNLSLDSEMDKGSKFTVAIDANVPDDVTWINSKEGIVTQTKQTQSETTIPALQGKILLAEDNPDNQALISIHVKKTGADLTIVENGQQAVDAALNEYFDLILMDMQMPIMGGIEAIKKLRDNHYKTPIATLTANAMKEDIQESKQAGADEFLTKPIDRKIFYDVLSKYLSPAYESQEQLNKPSAEPRSKFEFDDISDLVDMYISQLPETFYRIERYENAREWGEVKNEIHQLKGTGGAFGLPEITEQCVNIEKELISKNYSSAQQLIRTLAKTCEDLVNQHTPSSLSA